MNDELDILREVGSIAAGHGTIALSEILGKKVKLYFPSINIITPLEVPPRINPGTMAIVVFSRIMVGIEGTIALLLDEDNAAKIINLSYKDSNKERETRPGYITDMGLSLLKEVGNVIIGTYLNALSMTFKKMMIPPIPTLVSGSIEQILNTIIIPHGEIEYCVLIESVFEEPQAGLKGGFFLVLSPYAVKNIKEICRKQLEDLEK